MKSQTHARFLCIVFTNLMPLLWSFSKEPHADTKNAGGCMSGCCVIGNAVSANPIASGSLAEPGGCARYRKPDSVDRPIGSAAAEWPNRLTGRSNGFSIIIVSPLACRLHWARSKRGTLEFEGIALCEEIRWASWRSRDTRSVSGQGEVPVVGNSIKRQAGVHS